MSFPCLTNQEAIAFIEGISAGTERVDRHIEWCEICAEKIRRLQEMRKVDLKKWEKWRDKRLNQEAKNESR